MEGFFQKIKSLLGISDVVFCDKPLKISSAQVFLGSIFCEASKIEKNTSIVAEERRKIQGEMDKISCLIGLNRDKLDNEEFIRNAPQKVIDGARAMLEENMQRLKALEKNLEALQ